MANQGPDRRAVLEMLTLAALASQFKGFSRWAYAEEMHMHPMEVPATPKPATYKLQFFGTNEYAALDQLTEAIIPRDDTPGARDAGVAEFIDFMAAHDPEIQQPLRSGLQLLEARNFTTATPDHQQELLREIARDPKTVPFFKLARRYTVMGYYTTRIGLEQLDYPGLKLYARSPGCPHKDDPEHKHLPPARF
jgi:hypothetical protein